MSIFNGKALTVEIFGSSHDKFIGAKVKGLPKFKYDTVALQAFLDRRKPQLDVSTARKEPDIPAISVSGDELTVIFENRDVVSSDYADLYGKPRPSHADYSAYLKYGTLDFSGGGKFSARMTAPLCAVGGLCLQLLEKEKVSVAAYVSKVGSVKARSYRDGRILIDDIVGLRGKNVPSLDKMQEILNEITAAKNRGDSVGGQIECVVSGAIAALGAELFDCLEGKISRLLFAIPAVKAVEFGLGVSFAESYGHAVNDGLFYDGEKVAFSSNNAGGICGGIADGRDITFRATFKPTPSIAAKQNTVDLVSKRNCVIGIGGRHDACVCLRAVPSVESAAAIAVLDELLSDKTRSA